MSSSRFAKFFSTRLAVDVEMGRNMTSSHDMTSIDEQIFRAGDAKNMAEPPSGPHPRATGPGFDPGHVVRRNDGHPRQSLPVKQSPHQVGTRN